MMHRNQRHSILPSLVAGAALVMACIVYAEIRARPLIDDMTSSQTAAKISIASPALRQEMPEKARFAAIVERPVFSPTRRPPSEEAAAPIAALDAALSGVVISSGEQFALLKSGTSNEPVRLKEGDEILGWTVARIEPNRILVRHDTMEQELLLDFGAPAPPPPETALPNENVAQANAQKNGQDKGQTAGDAPEPVPPPEADESAPASNKPAK
jgi:hypothetical protein